MFKLFLWISSWRTKAVIFTFCALFFIAPYVHAVEGEVVIDPEGFVILEEKQVQPEIRVLPEVQTVADRALQSPDAAESADVSVVPSPSVESTLPITFPTDDQLSTPEVFNLSSPPASPNPQLPFDNTSKSSFSKVQDNTGNLIYVYSITTPPGRNTLQPEVKIIYSSQSPAQGGIYGSHWADTIPFIQRTPKMGVDQLYSTSTPSYFSSSLDNELATTTNPSIYVARTDEGSFRTYIFTSSTNQWVVKDKNGIQYTFGASPSTRQDDPANVSHVYKWMLEEIRDANNNYITYSYTKDAGQIYPATILYTGNSSTNGVLEVDFITTTRTDAATSTQAGFPVLTKKLISRIDVKVNGTVRRQYVFGYTLGDNGTRSLLSTVVESGTDESANTTTVPTTTFSYQAQVQGWSVSSTWYPSFYPSVNNGQDAGYTVADVNGDGLSDMLRSYNAGPNFYEAWINNGHGWDADPTWYPPILLTTNTFRDTGSRVVDVNGDGLSDIIRGYDNGSGSNTYEAWINNGHGWTSDPAWYPPVSLTSLIYDRGYKITDVNGDGLPDIIRNDYNTPNSQEAWINNGHGWTFDATWFPPMFLSVKGGQDAGYKIIDVNGDGLPDMLRSYNAGPNFYEAWINNGHGWTSDPGWYPPVLLTTNVFGDTGYKVIDINGDGLPDITRGYDSSASKTYEAYINNGYGWTFDQNWAPPLVWNYSGTDLGYKVLDVNGDGLPDIIRNDNNVANSQEAWMNSGRVNSLLRRVSLPQGGSTSFVYKPVSHHTTANGTIANHARAAMWTVAKVVTDDGFGNVATTSYQYAGGSHYFSNGFDTQFAGFASGTMIDPQGNVTKTYFHQGDASDSAHGEYSDTFSKIGKPYRVEQYDANGNLYQKTINMWDASGIAGSGAVFVKLSQSLQSTFDGDASHKDTAKGYAYDSTNGNQTQRIEYGTVTGNDDGTFIDSGSDLYTTTIAYASSASSTVIGLPKQVTVTDQASAQVKDTKYYYDNLAFGSVSKGNQTMEEKWKSGGTYINTQKTYNTYGLVVTSTDPLGKVTSYVYDAFNLYPVTSTDPLGYKTQYIYDYAHGKPKSVIDPNNLLTQTTYDGFGRVTKTQAPNLTTSSTQDTIESFVYTDTSGAVSVKQSKYMSTTSTVDSYAYYDGLGRLIQSRVAGAAPNTFETTDRVYDARGLLSTESLPYFSTGTAKTLATSTPALLTTYTYDPVQRLKTATNILGNTTTTYSDWKTTLTDANGKIKDLYYDAYKRLIQVDEHNGAATYSTFYTYDGNGNLTKIVDALGNVRNFTYDGLGRRLTAQDLHAASDATFGAWSYTYDNSGNLTSQVDPKNQTINYTYDGLNRSLTEDYTGQAGTEVTYTYDACAYGIGSMCTVSSTAMKIVNVYNPRRTLSSETKTISGTNYVTSYTYDRQGNQLTLTNPDASQVKYDYVGSHFIDKISKKETTDPVFIPVVNSTTYAPNGQVASMTFANGVTQVNTYDPSKLYRLTKRVSTLPNASKAQDLSYTYDAVGNIVLLSEAGATNTRRTVTYGYDDLYRLLSAIATGTTAGIPGYTQAFSYDALGNIVTSPQGNYWYTGNTGSLYANPHAATLVGGMGLTYDNNGNLIKTTSSTFSSASTSSTGWAVNGGVWNRRRIVTIDRTKVSGTSTLVNFPVLISSTDPEFKTVSNGGYVASSTGADIFFTSSNGSTKLNHEIESYDGVNGTLVAWVQVPSVATSTNTLLYLYYGNTTSTNQQNKTGTWDANTKGVWHLNNSLSDSTSNANNGINHNSTNLATGKMGSARSFTGVWDTVTVSSSASLQPSTKITFSTWINQSGAEPNYAKPIWYGQNLVNPWGAYGLYINANTDMALSLQISSTSTSYGAGPVSLTTSTWQYVVGTYDGAVLKMYLDGNLISSTNAAFKIGNYNATSGLSLGSSWNNDADWSGYLDEVRVASTTRSSDWIKTEFNNQGSPSTFYTLGAASGTSAGGSASSSVSWFSTGGTWTNRKLITVDHVKVSPVSQTTLSNFPILVSLTDSHLKSTSNGGYVASSTGADILFTSSDGLTKLDHEIESYTSTTGSLVAWVRVPTLPAAVDTGIYMYFGNATSSDQQNKTGTWDANTKGVWHFNNSLTDSTLNANNGANHNSTNLVAGKFANARSFTGAWDTVTVSSTPTLQPSTQLTLSTWINQSGAEPDYAKPIWYGQNLVNPWGSYGFYISASTDMALNLQLGSATTSYGTWPAASLTTSTWQYLVGTYDGAAMKLYLDGNLIGTSNAAFQINNYNATSGLSLGSSWNNDADWNGSLDEVRVASTTRSIDWIKTEYNNQSTSTMLSIGALETASTSSQSGVPPVVVSSSTLSTFTWDYLNRLTQVVGPSGTSTVISTSTYAYDPSGERIKSSVQTGTSTVTTTYPTKFYNITGSTPTKHIFANGMMIATIIGSGSSSTISSILTDHLSGSSILTNASGTIIEQTDYYPFGGTRIDTQTGGNEQRKFGGHEYDASSGLSYMHARYYNQNVGRFLSEDLAFLAVGNSGQIKQITGQELQQYLSDPQNFNSYSYARNNPIIIVDPNGQWIEYVIGDKNTIALGNWINNASNNNSTVRYALDHPYQTGAAVGVAGGAIVAAGVVALGGSITCGVVCGGGVAGVGAVTATQGEKIKEEGVKLLNGPINISAGHLRHVVNGHTIDGLATTGKSVFNSNEDVASLIRQGTQQIIDKAKGNYFQRVFDVGRNIGIDKATNQQTSWMTIITNKAGDMITTYPGKP